ncbi:hypothetical protein MBLNU457_5001t1 [Dothideomycetes sp. NU457]
MKTSTLAAASLLGLASIGHAVSPIQMRGSDFVDTGSGDRFYIIGIDYQPGGSSGFGTTNSDPLSNGTLCLRDAALMQELGVNTIRSYNVNPTLNHDECASIFNEAGIYMIIDVNSPLSGQNLDRTNPSGTYTTGYLSHVFSVVEAFMGYPNTLGFFSGNEIINDVSTAADNPPYIRAIQRDMKNYIAQHAPRTIPVGYSAADVRSVLPDQFYYLQCEIPNNGNDTSRSDFFGLNSYSWCGSTATFQSAGYDQLITIFGNTTIPVFFSEYGCNQVTPRVFDEVQALYGPQMTVMSGGLVYEFTEGENNYGVVNISSNGSAYLLPDFVNLQGQLNKLNVTLLQSGNATAQSATPPVCAASMISDNGFSNNFDIPSPPQGAQALINNGVQSANTGKIVSVTATSVQIPCFATNGALLPNLVLHAAQGPNVPNGANAATFSGSAPSTSATGSTGSSGSSGSSGSAGGAAVSTGSPSGTGSSSGSAASASNTRTSSATSFGIGAGSVLIAGLGMIMLLL